MNLVLVIQNREAYCDRFFTNIGDFVGEILMYSLTLGGPFITQCKYTKITEDNYLLNFSICSKVVGQP